VIRYAATSELTFEEIEYSVDKKLSNKLADYGFILYEDGKHKRQRFIKTVGDKFVQIQ